MGIRKLTGPSPAIHVDFFIVVPLKNRIDADEYNMETTSFGDLTTRTTTTTDSTRQQLGGGVVQSGAPNKSLTVLFVPATIQNSIMTRIKNP